MEGLTFRLSLLAEPGLPKTLPSLPDPGLPNVEPRIEPRMLSLFAEPGLPTAEPRIEPITSSPSAAIGAAVEKLTKPESTARMTAEERIMVVFFWGYEIIWTGRNELKFE